MRGLSGALLGLVIAPRVDRRGVKRQHCWRLGGPLKAREPGPL